MEGGTKPDSCHQRSSPEFVRRPPYGQSIDKKITWSEYQVEALEIAVKSQSTMTSRHDQDTAIKVKEYQHKCIQSDYQTNAFSHWLRAEEVLQKFIHQIQQLLVPGWENEIKNY